MKPLPKGRRLPFRVFANAFCIHFLLRNSPNYRRFGNSVMSHICIKYKYINQAFHVRILHCIIGHYCLIKYANIYKYGGKEERQRTEKNSDQQSGNAYFHFVKHSKRSRPIANSPYYKLGLLQTRPIQTRPITYSAYYKIGPYTKYFCCIILFVLS